MRKETLNITLRSQAGNNCLNVLCNLILSNLRFMSFKFNFRSFTICSDMPKFHHEICKIKDTFIKNGYSERLLHKCVKIFLNKVFIPQRIIQIAEKKQVATALPYMGMISTEINVKLHKTLKQLLPA